MNDVESCGMRLPRISGEPAIDSEDMGVTRKPLTKAVCFRPVYWGH